MQRLLLSRKSQSLPLPASRGLFSPSAKCLTTVHTKVDALPYIKDHSLGASSSGEAVDYLQKILTSRVYDVSVETPLQHAQVLSTKLSNKIYYKREDMQPVFSFKCRGAHNKISSLSADQLKHGIVACSAGNHAQGVALSAKKLGINAVIVMPLATPSIKIDGVKKHGGIVKLHGNNYDEAQAEAMRMVVDEGRTLIHPFDDPEVIAGQGTVGMEIIKKLTTERLDAIFCCVGGGGLIAGVAAYVKRVRPEVKIIGVEAEDAAAMTLSLQKGKRVKLDSVCLFADGAAVRLVGEEPFRIAKNYVDAMVTVNNDEICAAIKDTFNDTRSILEPAGALGVAGITKYIKMTGIRDGTFVGVTSGANMDFDRLRFVSERADSRETRVCVKIPEKPGSFLKLYENIYPRNITEFSYRYNDEQVAHIYMSFHGKGNDDVTDVIKKLNDGGFTTKDLSDNELAKAHARHLAGGRARHRLLNEELYRFEFPEAPGALDRFLRKLPGSVNISLFHYRNYGHDIGRVLVGMTVPPEQKEALTTGLKALGYKYFDETKNPVYIDFL